MSGSADAYASPLIDAQSTNVNSSSDTTLVPVNKRRRYLLIQNVSDVDVLVSIDGTTPTADTAGTVELAPKGSIAFEGMFCPTNKFVARSASGSGKGVTVWEG